uniref:Uncharacterized protein n=1 Tax=Opuntia streptacantha TaxID=393608 RepID=A0A7C8Z5J4_OPUST
MISLSEGETGTATESYISSKLQHSLGQLRLPNNFHFGPYRPLKTCRLLPQKNSIRRVLKFHWIVPRVLNHCTPRTISQLPSEIKRTSAQNSVPCNRQVNFLQRYWHFNSLPSATDTGSNWTASILHPSL